MKEWIVEPKQMALIRFGVGKYEKIHNGIVPGIESNDECDTSTFSEDGIEDPSGVCALAIRAPTDINRNQQTMYPKSGAEMRIRLNDFNPHGVASDDLSQYPISQGAH